MNRFSKSLMALAAVSSITACSNQGSQSHSGVISVNAAGIVADATLSPSQKAEKLALAGEQLATPTGFMYADMIFDQALSMDSTNQRAQFYKAFLATPMALRGILARIKPLATTTAESTKAYEKSVAHVPKSGLKTFLFDGQADIKTEKDAQGFVDSIYQAQDKFRQYLKTHKNSNLTLNLNDWEVSGSLEQAVQDCPVNQNGDGSIDIQTCDISTALQVNLNRADIEALQQITAGMEIYIGMLNSYDLSGSLAVNAKYANQDQSPSNTVVWKELSKNSSFGKIRNAKALSSIVGMGIDAVAGVRWAASIQNQLCPLGTDDARNRKGFLFSTGICIPSVSDDGTPLEDTLKIVDTVLAGQSITAMTGANGETQTKVRPIAVLQNPVVDLKSLHPVFDDCGNVQAVSNDTLNGLFPNHDANSVLAASAKADCGFVPSSTYGYAPGSNYGSTSGSAN